MVAAAPSHTVNWKRHEAYVALPPKDGRWLSRSCGACRWTYNHSRRQQFRAAVPSTTRFSPVSRLVQLRANRSNTITAVALGLSIFDETSGVWKNAQADDCSSYGHRARYC